MIETAHVRENPRICREHHRLTLHVTGFPAADPGQFVHICPPAICPNGAETSTVGVDRPFLRRAFSIAGLRRSGEGAELDLIYRVVGKATRWMQSLRPGDAVSLLGPLGNRFPVPPEKSLACLIAGGVGLPPMLWLAEALHRAGKRIIAFCGARRADLLPLTLDPTHPADPAALHARPSAEEFRRVGAEVVIATDDGSAGYSGHVGAALRAFTQANPFDPADTVFYTCGPEPMMAFVASLAGELGVECHVCMERAMACGTGLCQSCVVPVRDRTDPEGWRYRLCCTDGPVFDASNVLWEDPQQAAAKCDQPTPSA